MKSFYKFRFIVYISILLFFSSISLFSFSDSSKNINDVYLIKSRWHTGLIFRIDELSIKYIEALKHFKYSKYVDIGWGDRDFYQSPKDFDLYLAFKALFLPTESVVRIEGYNYEIDDIISYADFCIKFDLTDKNLIELLKFIDSSFYRNEKKRLIITLQKANNRIIFFKSKYTYHIFETCNKWVAKGLVAAGFEISPAWVITAENLFEEVKKYGKVIRWKK